MHLFFTTTTLTGGWGKSTRELKKTNFLQNIPWQWHTELLSTNHSTAGVYQWRLHDCMPDFMHLLAMSVAEAGVLNRGLSTYFNFLILPLEQCVFASPLNNKEYTCTIKVTFFLALTCFHQWRPLLQWCTHHPSAFWRWWSSQLHLLPAVQNTHQAGHPDTAGQLPGYDPSSSIYTPEGDTKNTCRYAVHC